MIKLWWHWLLVSLGIKKTCNHPDSMRAVRCETSDRIYYICAICLSGWHVNKPKEKKQMTVNDFAVMVSQQDVGKKEVNIAQIKSVLKITNELVDGALYKLIRKS